MNPKILILSSSKISLPRQRILTLLKLLYRALGNHRKLRPHLTIFFVGPKKMAEFNRKFRKKNYPTDVLSFPGDGRESLGEIALCPFVLKKQAKVQGHSFNKELDYILIHGFLHLLGFDHEKSRREELKMFKLQDRLFKQISEE